MDLENIKNPKFLKKMDEEQLVELSSQIRNFIIDKVSNTGGHLSSNLGIVELTIALHKIFDTPKDKIIFDVGHQCYTHKILTGRANKFDTLRQFEGLSGFQKMDESIYDCYEAGHSSTSLSAALGYALARDINKSKENVIAVIGDGSIGNGLAYEALNHIGSLNTNLIVILNDNEMSISKNVGAIKNNLDKIRSNYYYKDKKKETKKILEKLPYLGKTVENGITLVKESLKKIYMREGYLFEEFGFNYYGPINGHDYKELELYLNLAKKENGPVLLHVITNKGQGYKFSEEDIEGVWHGTGPFDRETGIQKAKPSHLKSWSEVISTHLVDLASKDKNIMAITPAMANGAKLNKFKELYKNRFIDVGIAEEHALVLANALRLAGKKPFVSIYSTFLQRGYDQIFQDIARMNSNVVIGIDRAGLVGEDGETHQGIYDISFLNHIPNIVIMAPSDSIEAKNMLFTAFNINNPVAIRYSRGKTEFIDTKEKIIKIGKWEFLSKGLNGTIISYGDFLESAKEIGKELNLNVINAKFIKPMDTKMLNMIKEKPIFVYEESSKIGSLGSSISSYFESESVFIKTFAINDKFVKQGKCDIILNSLKLDKNSVKKQIKKYLGG